MDESGARKIQQVEAKDKPVEVNQYQGLLYWCDNCQKIHYGVIPETIYAHFNSQSAPSLLHVNSSFPESDSYFMIIFKQPSI
jgi:hypothetical protein